MIRVLIIRTTSLGDVVHALPIVRDLHDHRGDVQIDWVAEESFAALVRLNRGVNRVIPVALRRWRHRFFSRSTWREALAFRHDLMRERYDVVIDLQEQVKGALLAALARGPVHGPDCASAREPAASLLYRHRYRVAADKHLLDRCRRLVGKVFGYEPVGPPRFGLEAPPVGAAPDSPYVVCVHGSSREEKLWPEAHWSALLEHLTKAGLVVVLPWGDSAEAARSARLAAGALGVVVPPWRTLSELAALLAAATLVVGVDTGLTHLAAALGRPTVALFVSSDPQSDGVERASAWARDLGGHGRLPTPAQAIAAAGALLRARPSC